MSLRRNLVLLIAVTCLIASSAHALDRSALAHLLEGDNEEKIAAIGALLAEGDPQAATLLRALADGELQIANKRWLIVRGDAATDALSGEVVAPLPEGREDIAINNRIRRELGLALAGFDLLSHDRAIRMAAVKTLGDDPSAPLLPLIRKVLEQETDPNIRTRLELIRAAVEMKTGDRAARLAAIRTLGDSSNPGTKALLAPLLAKNPDGGFVEPDEALRAQAQRSLRAVEDRLAWGHRLGLLFSGVSLGSILLIAALGLAITYGLMGVINMAHGELIMIGAYTTWLVQNLVRSHAPAAFDWYPLLAVPAAFTVAALVGMVMERSVIRYLYGRPLETLLATWGISLVLIQSVRSLFGAQNVPVENPVWMSGGIEVMSNLVLPWNRVVIIGFAAVVLAAMWLLLARTRLGLFVRGVTQNRAMAGCMGVPTARVDTWAFGLGCGIAGLAGCALSQIGNVGPDLGQAYIVDSFMVVVLGGVGQLAGTVYAALGLGLINKGLEAWSGAVLAKIAVLIFIIIVIQKRPQGLFALKGRAVDA